MEFLMIFNKRKVFKNIKFKLDHYKNFNKENFI